MSKLKLLSFFFASLFMLSLVSCSKDEDADLSKTDLLTGGEWTGHEFWTQGNNITETLKNFLDYDVAKTKANFSKNGSYTFKYDGAVMQSGAWKFGTGEQTIIFDEGTDEEETLTINKLTSSELYLESKSSMTTDGFMILDGEMRMKR